MIKPLPYNNIIPPAIPAGRQVCNAANCCMNIKHDEAMYLKKKKCCEKFKKKGKRCKKCPGRVD